MRNITSSLTLLLLWGLIHLTAGAAQSPVTCYSNNTACEDHDDYLYLSPDLILHLPDFKEINCEQNFPGSLDFATSGLVMSGGAERLMMCGGQYMTTCWMLETGGWVDMQNYIDRTEAAASGWGTAWLVSGGTLTAYPYTMFSTTQVFSEDTWRDGPQMPHAVAYHCQVEMDGAVYVIGGITGRFGHGSTQNSVYKLEQGSAEWVAASSLDTARAYHSCAVLDSRIYVMGGSNSENTTEVYDPASDTWTYGPVLPTERSWDAQAIGYGGVVYVVDGYHNQNVYSYTPGPGAEWETLPGVNIPYDHRPIYPAPVVTSDKLYCE